ncbi:hypothetical protein [Lysinibacillus pakistanensis]|uniref:MFS transporter n=1 Tax=Lysinibacillus pakistanensis TaxID=759811 RepID=A0AAX3WV76_9BACI|nr:hypothetical protein [Lysinibacillus pakistanensis]MDM5230576.1 hypothetical protein [Lysinibacillus pakistanensis]WHY46153.1 hypothetical protein QNH22_23350 [Lysinibacillus pakistanensis]WHY51164.1 hypothetical protein QNH24_23310 [Lysinibacillus pakistanensis]
MEERDYELFDALKKRPDKDPNIDFSKQLRQSLEKTPIKKIKRFSIATILTIPVTLAVLLFVFRIGTEQSFNLKNAALLTINQEKNLSNILFIFLMSALSFFILFVYFKGLTRGKLVYMTFALSFLAWVGNLVYAENQNIDESIVKPSYSESYDYSIKQDKIDEIQLEHDK